MKRVSVSLPTWPLVVTAVLLLPLAAPALAAPGNLDTSFSADGQVTTNFTRRLDWAFGVAIQPDGLIVAAGQAGEANPRFAVARYRRRGTLDTSFGGDGKVTTDFNMGHGSERAHGVAIQPDGKIVAAGVAGDPEGRDTKFALVRYNSDGTLDSSFGESGKVLTDFTSGHDAAAAVAIQTDGLILAAGSASEPADEGGPPAVAGFALARYETDGTLDTSFGDSGKVMTGFTSGYDSASGMAVQVDGKIVAVGGAGLGGQGGKFALARYNSDGTLDASFSEDGKRTASFGTGFAVASDAAIQADGKLVVGGTEAIDVTAPDYKLALARFNANGTFDTAFSGDGRVRNTFAFGASGVAIQSDGKIVAAGGAGGAGGRFALARYGRRGRLDTSFGGDGKVITNFTPGFDSASDVALQTNGRIVVGGGAGGAGGRFALARYLAS